MSENAEELWELMEAGSDEMADILGLDAAPSPFSHERALPAIDDWLAGRDEPLDEEEAALLGMLLARVLIESHGGGLTRINERNHPLQGEWAVSGFARGIVSDYHVPFVVSAVRIGIDRSLTAREWYRQILDDGGRS